MNNFDIQPYKDKLQSLEKQAIYLQGQIDMQKLGLNSLLNKSNELTYELEILDEVNQFVSQAINKKVIKVKHQIEDIINKGLAFVYKDDFINITVDTEFKNNRTQFKVSISDAKVTSANLEESFGGGVLATVGFLFKVVTNILLKNERLMVFDESLTFVSKHYQENLSTFIRELCADLDLTLVLISHQPLLHSQADLVYEAYKDGGADAPTRFRLIESE